jgi:hypothetical protein
MNEPIAASATTIAIALSLALYLLVTGPVLLAGFYAIRRRDPSGLERAATDVQRFIDLRERARAELAATGSLDRFIEIKNEARKHLWQPASYRAQVRVAAPANTWLPNTQAVRRSQRSAYGTSRRRRLA